MAWASPPRTFECLFCGWSHTVPHPISDCRIEGLDHFRSCPDCSCAVTHRDATFLEIAKARLVAWKRRRNEAKS